MIRALKATLTMFAYLVIARAQTATKVPGHQRPQQLSAYEQATMELENRKLEIEKVKAAAEEAKAKVEVQKAQTERDAQKIELFKSIGTILAIGVPLGALFFSVWSLKRTVEAQTLAKLGEIAMQGHSPAAVLNRAKFLTRLYQTTLPADFEDVLNKIKADEFGKSGTAPEIVEIRTALIRMLAEHPAERDRILADWLTIWPNDDWAAKLKGGSPAPGQQ